MVNNKKATSYSLLIYLLRALIFLPGLIGPVLTGCLYVSMEEGDSLTVWKELIIPISIGYGASVVIAVLVHLWIKDFLLAVLIAVPICLFMYGVLTTVAVWVEGDPEGWMWLPVILLFIGINGLPMAVIVPFFTISALRGNRLFMKVSASGERCKQD
jgi:hypothetical protein